MEAPTPAAGAVEPAVHVRGLVKRYGEVTAVDGIDLDVHKGETFGFLGPNGAGKSTTISILCTLARPSEGSARVAGHDVVTERDEVRRHIGLVFQDTTLDQYLTAERNLRFHAELYGVPRDLLDDRLRKVLEMVGLWERRGSKVQNFSGGMKRRLEIARGLLHSPRVLFLDEPTVGLDPQTRLSIWGYIDELRQTEDITIFLTTHYMDEAENCDRIAIMDAGRVIALDTPAGLKASLGTDTVRLRTPDDAVAAEDLRDRFQLDPTVGSEGITVGVPDGEGFVPTVVTGLRVPVTSISVSRPTLDDVFLSYTGRTIRDAEQAPGMTNPFAQTRR
ncbi:ATP-binding cassette domain-containing protein [Iamia majanohamensis]|uniref:ATP-binding cassette domain-containing protein n=1 Tax=Iamia majanohamensis TaxID=467976 RepID=A0AAE9Y8D3_9ACTN|nr:ATP-binding cassette domain-containing protein [Iamia majanohamensis]WCO68734.1 ATP-binding cassette domain-containing protein [Iamia majanohamensis]